jgi:hypothetical protein
MHMYVFIFQKYVFSMCNHGANPTIASYNASVVNFYNATGSVERFRKQKFCLLL